MDDSMPKDIGPLLRYLREEKGLSVRGLAAAARVDSTWLSRVERGVHSKPDPRALHRMAQVLGVETLQLFMAADYAGGMPSFAPYLRSTTPLSEDEIGQLQAHFELMVERHGREKGGRDGQRHSSAA